MKKSVTWQNLKEFIDQIPQEHLDKDVSIEVGETAYNVVSGFTSEALYVNKVEADNIYDEKTFLIEKESGTIEFPEEYIFQPAGIPYLTTEF